MSEGTISPLVVLSKSVIHAGSSILPSVPVHGAAATACMSSHGDLAVGHLLSTAATSPSGGS